MSCVFIKRFSYDLIKKARKKKKTISRKSKADSLTRFYTEVKKTNHQLLL